MKETFFNICEKYLTGFYSIKIKRDLYLNFPKLAPVFTIAFGLSFLGYKYEVPIVEYIGNVLVAVGVFGFFYHNVFPNRRPKS
jgi:hypothetical protein